MVQNECVFANLSLDHPLINASKAVNSALTFICLILIYRSELITLNALLLHGV